MILVTVNDKEAKRQILRNAAELRQISVWKNIFVSPDFTFKERQANKILRDELKRRRSQGETNLIIRNGKIICKQRSSAPHI